MKTIYNKEIVFSNVLLLIIKYKLFQNVLVNNRIKSRITVSMTITIL